MPSYTKRKESDRGWICKKTVPGIIQEPAGQELVVAVKLCPCQYNTTINWREGNAFDFVIANQLQGQKELEDLYQQVEELMDEASEPLDEVSQ